MFINFPYKKEGKEEKRKVGDTLTSQIILLYRCAHIPVDMHYLSLPNSEASFAWLRLSKPSTNQRNKMSTWVIRISMSAVHPILYLLELKQSVSLRPYKMQTSNNWQHMKQQKTKKMIRVFSPCKLFLLWKSHNHNFISD